jgi:hypothetical protein
MNLDNIQPVILSTPNRTPSCELESDLIRIFGAWGF